MPRTAAFLLLATVLLGTNATHAETIWIEGESAVVKEVTAHPWYNGVKKDLLSGGAWASHFDDKKPGKLEYDVTVPADGEYTFFIRANPVGAKLTYQIGDGASTDLDMTKGKSDMVNVADDDKPDVRFLAWFQVGKVKLTKGTVRVRFKLHSNNNNHGAIDCFVFTTEPFTPNGSLKPGQKLNRAMPGTWAFEPDADRYEKPSPIDLRKLNEKVAGATGWVKRTADGDFALGDGTSVRFWAVNTYAQNSLDLEGLKGHARFLAKRGVNMVRFHGAIEPKGEQSKLTDVDHDEIDRAQKLVAAMKGKGIYTTISPYWAATDKVRPGWGIAGHPKGSPWGLLFWDETLQQGYKAWVKELLTRPSPYTGIPLGKDPAVALFQIQNEDSMLFWTIGGIKGEELKRLQKLYAGWLAKQYGSLAKARERWAGEKLEGDADDAAGFYGMWEFHGGHQGGKRQRLADQVHFYADTMYRFNKMIGDYVRKELGCPVLVNAGNWRTANQVTLLDAERWSYTANEVIGSNRYVTSAHVNPNDGHRAGYMVSKGDFYEDISSLKQPRKLAINAKQVVGMPFIVSESTWVSPMSYQAEAPFLVAAYSSLSGVDAYYWFAIGEPGFDRGLTKFQVANPAIMGGFPAAALLFRRGYVRRGDAAVHEERRAEDLWQLRSTLLAEEEAFDPNRDAGAIPKESSVKTAVNPLAFLVGPVEVKYDGDPGKNRVADMAKYIDENKKRIRSITGELELDHAAGCCRLDAPKAQGVAGFLDTGSPYELSAVRIESKNAYASVLAVSLDGQDLKASKQVLVQVTTQCRPYGWKDAEASFQDNEKKHTFHGKRIEDTGAAPWNVWNTDLTISLKNSGLSKATLLDANGYAVGPVAGTRSDGSFRVRLPANALYVVLV
jgi:hypothetical protein